MSERSVSASWGLQSDLTPTLSPVQSHQPNPSSRNSFFYTNTHANTNTNGDYTTQQSQQQTLARPHAPPSANSLAWLRPWRTTQDCRQGGLALLYSMQEILTNVERARQSSMEAVYAPVRSSSPASATVPAAQFGTAEDSANTSLTRRLSMRLNASTSQPRSRETDGDDVGVGRCSNASRSVSREREAATPTLLDYMLPGSSSGNTRHVPPMWLDSDAPPLPGSSVSQSSVGGGVDGDRPKILTRASWGLEEQHSLSLGGADAQRSEAASLSHTPKAAFATANVLPEKQEGKEAVRGSSSSGAAAAAAAITDTSRSSQPLPPAASPKQQETHRSERQTAATDSPVVPAIPRFDDLKAEQEALQRQMQALQGPHPRSEAAQKKQRALLHSSDNDSDTEGQSSGSGGSPGGPQQATARRGGPPGVGTARPMQPHQATSPDRKLKGQTALRPGSEGGERYLSLSDSSSSGGGGGGTVDDGPVDDAGDGTDSERVVMFYDEEDMDGEGKADDDEEEAASDRMSETNFGEGGHLACVPGDTLHSRYTLLKALGVGRSSRVWLAADLEQCSLARRHLIRQLGEREARRLFRPQERPMFVAIKVFRCSAMYADCAEYEEKLSTYVTGCVKLRQLRLPRPLQSSPTPPRCRSRANSLSSTSPAAASTAPPPPAHTSPSGQSSASNGSLTMPSALSTASRRSSTSPRPLSAAAQASQRLTTFRDAFTVSGQYGVHQCLVMDVLGAGVDKAINETYLAGFPAEVARSILLSTLQGLSVLAACHIIHTDLKPENLLFTDLEADIAAEMRRFQSLLLQTRSRSGLWSSFTHSRENVLAYAQRREEKRRAEQQEQGEEVAAAQRTGSLNNSASGGSSCEHTRVHSPRSLSNSESISLLAQTHVPHLVRGNTDDDKRSGPGVLSDQRKAVSGSGGSSSGSFHHHETNSNSYNRCGDDKPFTSAPRSLRAARPRRPAYQVRVTDFGLSFITPPCLRAGLRAMACYAADIGIAEDEFIRDDPLSQLQWLYSYQQEQQQQLELTGAARLTGWADVDGVELRALQQEAAREDDERLRRTCDMDDRSAGDRSPSGVTHDASSAADPFTSVLSAGSGATAAAPPPSRAPNDFSVVTQQQTGVSVRHVDTESASALCSLHHGSSDSLDAGKGVTPTRASTDAFGRLLQAPPAALRTASYHSPVSHTLTAAPSSALMPSSAPESPHVTATEKSIFPQRCPPLELQKRQLSDTQERGEREEGKDEGGAQRRPEQEKEEERGPTGRAHHGTMPPLTLTRFVDPRPPTTLDTSMTSNDAGICKGDGGDAQQHISPTNRSAAVHARATALLSPRSPQRRATTTAAASSSSSPSATAFSSLTALRRLELAIVRSQRYTRGATVQSREYRSPEVLLGNFFLPSCDVWSLGCIAYELITGRFLMDCIGDREHFGRQLARQLRRDQKQRQAQQQQQQQRGFREDTDTRYGSALDEEGGESESEVEWDGQPIYVDDHEQDLDVFHLKSMIRLLGPPPLSYLNQRPIGLFVTDYFDHNGDFRFWEDGEAAEAGVGLADVYRRPEQRYWSRQQRQGEDGAGAATGQSAALRPLTSLVSAVEAESMDDFECHIRDYTSNGEDDDDDDNDDAYDRGSLRSRPFSSMQRVDAATTGNVASHLFSSSSVAGPVDLGNSPSDATPSMLSMTPHSLTGPSAATSYGRHPSVAAAASGARAASLLDTRNYPIETPDWLEVRQILREKLATEEEALGFEGFLLKCLQWDPAQRATAAELLGDPWMVKYSPHIAEAVDSDGDDEESEAEEEEEEGRS